MKREVFSFDAVAPARERGLKFYGLYAFCSCCYGRSRKGAWIEILALFPRMRVCSVSLPQGSVD